MRPTVGTADPQAESYNNIPARVRARAEALSFRTDWAQSRTLFQKVDLQSEEAVQWAEQRHMFILPVPGKWMQEDQKVRLNHGYRVSLRLTWAT